MIEIANFISVLPLYYLIITFITTIFSLFIFTNNIKYHFVYTIGIILSLVLPQLIKLLTKFISPINKIWYRPDGAKGCDFRSIKGFAEEFTPGFPSGHMTITTYILIFNILLVLKKKYKYKYKYLIILLNIFGILLMSWARNYKKCHKNK